MTYTDEIFEILKKENPDIVGVIIIGLKRDENDRATVDFGATGLLPKPLWKVIGDVAVKLKEEEL